MCFLIDAQLPIPYAATRACEDTGQEKGQHLTLDGNCYQGERQGAHLTHGGMRKAHEESYRRCLWLSLRVGTGEVCLLGKGYTAVR